MELKDLQKIQTLIENLRIEQHRGLSIEIMDEKLYSIEMEVFKLTDKVCDGKETSDENGGLIKPAVLKSVCAFDNMCKIKNKDGRCRKNCKHYEVKQTVL